MVGVVRHHQNEFLRRSTSEDGRSFRVWFDERINSMINRLITKKVLSYRVLEAILVGKNVQLTL